MTEPTLFTRTLTGLSPANDAAREALEGIAHGTVIEAKINRPRNLPHHRLYWALCSAIASSVGARRENISDFLKLKSGHYVTLKTKSGLLMLPRSISFAKMDQAAFNAFFKECTRVVSEEFLGGIPPGPLADEIRGMIGIPEEVG